MPEIVEVAIAAPAVIEIVEPIREVVELVVPGPQGPPGPQTDLDDLLEAVDVAVADYFVLHPQSFVYDQPTAVFRWDILHPLDHRPVVVVTDSAGDVWRGAVSYPASNRVYVDFNIPLAGRATLT